MPEKPEVITVAKSLEPLLVGREIVGCNVFWDNIIAAPTTDAFRENVIHHKILKIQTRGKFLVLDLDPYVLLIHLRMEGKFLFRQKEDPIGKHEHVEFLLDDGCSFRYHDVRKFGKMYLLEKDTFEKQKPIQNLGLEYYDDCFTGPYLYTKIHALTKPIKTVLLDQSIIAGIGNIYANEILFLSKISPKRVASKVSKKECECLVQNTKKVLERAVQLGGTTIRSFTSSEGVHGLFQNELMIHGREGETCPNCQNPILKEYVGGRGTYYCKRCQK